MPLGNEERRPTEHMPGEEMPVCESIHQHGPITQFELRDIPMTASESLHQYGPIEVEVSPLDPVEYPGEEARVIPHANLRIFDTTQQFERCDRPMTASESLLRRHDIYKPKPFDPTKVENLRAMEVFITTKTVRAMRMNKKTYIEEIKKEVSEDVFDSNKNGYLVVYPDGYVSWCPAETFRACSIPVSNVQKNFIFGSNFVKQ